MASASAAAVAVAFRGIAIAVMRGRAKEESPEMRRIDFIVDVAT
jgi:hypothetical protein